MTVKELIEVLKDSPEEGTVYIPDGPYYFIGISVCVVDRELDTILG